jgi:hypothetical protein
MPITTRSRGIRGAVLVLAGGLVFAACGDNADDPGDASPTTGAPVSGDPPAEPDGETIAVTAVDYRFEGLPATANVGDKLVLTNESERELHELVAIRLPDGETRSSAELVALPQEEQEALSSGPPAAVLLVPPGGAPQIDALGDGTLSEPGRYLLICAIPTGADPQAYLKAAQTSGDGPPDVPGGPPHLTQGMHTILEVS